MDVFLGIINVLLILNAIILIVSVLMQEGTRQGLGAIAGGAETFFGKSKGKSYEGKLEMITKVSVATFIIFTVTMTAINARSGISNVAPADLTQAPAVTDILKGNRLEQGDGLDTTLPAEESAGAETTAEGDTAPATEATDAADTAADDSAAVTDEAATEPTAAPTDEPIAEATVEPAA